MKRKKKRKMEKKKADILIFRYIVSFEEKCFQTGILSQFFYYIGRKETCKQGCEIRITELKGFLVKGVGVS